MPFEFSPRDHAAASGLRSIMAGCAFVALLTGAMTLTSSLPAHAASVRYVVDNTGQQAGGRGAPRATSATSPSSPQVLATRRQRSSGAFWTPERMRDAEPMDLPLVTPDEVGPAFAPQSLRAPGEARSRPGAPPSIDVAPDFDNQLFEPREPEFQLEPQSATGTDLAPLAASPDGALSSNSRVFPRAALTAYPYRTAGRLFWHDPGRNIDTWCSASVIQRRLVVTAGHCVYNAEQGHWHTNFRFIPAYDEGAAPFEAWDFEQVFTTLSWAQGGGRLPNAADFAILVITDRIVEGETRAVGDAIGWLGWQTDVVANSHVTILGYPGNLDNGQRMQQTTSQTFAVVEPNAAEFGSVQGGGSSGGPYILNFGEMAEGQDEPAANVVVGIQSYAYFDLATRQPIGQAGTSIINGEFTALFEASCEATRGNCA